MAPPLGRMPVLLAKDLGGLLLYTAGAPLLNRIPRPALGLVARAGAGVVRRIQPSLWTDAHDELEKLFGTRPLPSSEAMIVKEALRLAMYDELEVLRYPGLGPDSIDGVCKIEGREHLDSALARGRGAIVLIGHFGANQMIMPALGHKGYRMNQLSAPPTVWADILADTRTTVLWKKVLQRRWELEQRLPVRHINVFKFLRPAFECLARNEVLGVAFDGGGGGRWTKVKLLERMANVSTQPAQLWRSTGAALLPTVVVHPAGSDRHRIVLEEPLFWREPGGAEPRGDALRANTQAYVDRLSTWIERFPDHYLHFLLMRRSVRATDVVPFFDDYPAPMPGLDPERAARRLRDAGSRT
jgi:phosphatidylinositol dimannoside acyltransferase